jgi:predicted metalloprotease with PDZ domain
VKTLLLALSMLALMSSSALAQGAATIQPAAMPAAIAAPRDVAYPGTMRLHVDATDTVRHIYRVRQTIPIAAAGPMTLLFPRWLPGTHAPTGRIEQLAGLTIRAGATRLEWTRDAVDGFAFHVTAPNATPALEIEFQILTAVESSQGRIVMTDEMLNLQWNAVALYPAGYFTSRIPVEASVKLPEGWQFGVALETASTAGGVTTFKPVPFDQLVDSPMFAGRYFKRFELGRTGTAPVYLNVVADRPELLEAKPEHIEAHRSLVDQAHKLFGGYHYDHYDFLLALTERMGGIGLEHHQSSENGTIPAFFTEWDKSADTRGLLPHELAHSWNGKFRRPADLWTANFNAPMRDSLLWVYEGQTQYWGYVLSARSGMYSKQQALDAIAATAAVYDHRRGREWRPLQDTTNDPIIAMRRPIPWRSWQRSEDYYSEAQLIWLDADTLIRDLSKGQKSLDDFSRAFFGINNGSFVPATYNFDDIVRTLNAVQPHDWTKFLRTRLDAVSEDAPLDGIARGGYKLVYSDTPTDFYRDSETRRRTTDLTYSLGLTIGRDAKLTDVLWEGPAFKAGLTVGTELVAVNGTAYSAERIKDTVKASKTASEPIELIVKNGERFRTIRIDYHDGLRYPRLERNMAVPARLDDILAARSN